MRSRRRRRRLILLGREHILPAWLRIIVLRQYRQPQTSQSCSIPRTAWTKNRCSHSRQLVHVCHHSRQSPVLLGRQQVWLPWQHICSSRCHSNSGPGQSQCGKHSFLSCASSLQACDELLTECSPPSSLRYLSLPLLSLLAPSLVRSLTRSLRGCTVGDTVRDTHPFHCAHSAHISELIPPSVANQVCLVALALGPSNNRSHASVNPHSSHKWLQSAAWLPGMSCTSASFPLSHFTVFCRTVANLSMWRQGLGAIQSKSKVLQGSDVLVVVMNASTAELDLQSSAFETVSGSVDVTVSCEAAVNVPVCAHVVNYCCCFPASLACFKSYSRHSSPLTAPLLPVF